MNDVYKTIDATVTDTDKLWKTLQSKKIPQVRSDEEKVLIKATALAWFNNHRSVIVAVADSDALNDVDELFKVLLSASDRATSRSTYKDILKSLRKALLDVRDQVLVKPGEKVTHTSDAPPDLSILISDSRMKEILVNRWRECTKCVSSDAPLAATVMMGGLLEALLLARLNRETEKSHIFRAAAAPKNRIDGKTLPLNEWTLRHYIDVSHELGWISQSARDIGEVVRDYRNYIHPYKEFSHGVRIDKHDAGLFWEITKGILRQLIEKIK